MLTDLCIHGGEHELYDHWAETPTGGVRMSTGCLRCGCLYWPFVARLPEIQPEQVLLLMDGKKSTH